MLRNMTISSTGKSTVSAFTNADPSVNVADALSTKMIACRRAARRLALARLLADVSIGRTLLQREARLHHLRLVRQTSQRHAEMAHEGEHRCVVSQHEANNGAQSVRA